jgi:hypothetical protein
LETELDSYNRLSNLLLAMIARPNIQKDNNVSRPCQLVYSLAKRAQNNFYQVRYIKYRAHSEYLKTQAEREALAKKIQGKT